MKVQVEHCSSLGWFVDVWVGDGWKNVSCYRTEALAQQAAGQIRTVSNSENVA